MENNINSGIASYKKGRTRNLKLLYGLAGTAILASLGFLLMMLGKYMPFGALNFLEVEPSDAMVIVAYSMFGFWSSFFVGIFKALLHMASFGPTGAPIPIGQITAFLSSMLYSVSMLFFDRVLHWTEKKIGWRILSYVLSILFISFVLTLLNYLFITPTYLVYGSSFLTVADVNRGLDDPSSPLYGAFTTYFGNISNVYPLAIFIAYFPFNIVKGIFVFGVYEVLFERLIKVMKKRGLIAFNNRNSQEEVKEERKKEETHLAEKPEIQEIKDKEISDKKDQVNNIEETPNSKSLNSSSFSDKDTVKPAHSTRLPW